MPKGDGEGRPKTVPTSALILVSPLRNGICFHRQENRNYVINQKPESVFKIPYSDPMEAAHRAWQVGNLHFPAQFHDSYLLVEGDYAVRLMLERSQISFEESIEVSTCDGGFYNHGSESTPSILICGKRLY